MMRLFGAVAAFVLALAACSGDGSVLESDEPRVADDAGIVSDATLERIELDGERRYEIRDDVESFKTRSHEITALLSWEGNLVHLGLDGDGLVRWIAGIGVVSDADPPIVVYSGIFERLEAGQAYFEDGTVLPAEDGLSFPEAGTEVVCEIGASHGRIVSVV